MYLIETYFYKDTWINETPSEQMYGTKEQCIEYLKREFEKNKEYEPELDLEELSLLYSTDGWRNYAIYCTELKPLIQINN